MTLGLARKETAENQVVNVRASEGAGTTQTMTVNGITTKNLTNFKQGGYGAYSGGANPVSIPSQWATNASTLNASWVTSVTFSIFDWLFTGDIELESKPTWAY